MSRASRPLVKDPALTRRRLVDAGAALMRRQGFAATGVDAICREAGVTKGAFFHHFESKEHLAEAAVDAWCTARAGRYLNDMGAARDSGRVRLERFLDGLVASIREPEEFPACLLGMISQEVALANPSLRGACEARFRGWTSFVAGLLDAAKKDSPAAVDFDPGEIAWMLNGLWQGSLLVAKTCQDVELAAANLRHARAYIDGLLGPLPSA